MIPTIHLVILVDVPSFLYVPTVLSSNAGNTRLKRYLVTFVETYISAALQIKRGTYIGALSLLRRLKFNQDTTVVASTRYKMMSSFLRRKMGKILLAM